MGVDDTQPPEDDWPEARPRVAPPPPERSKPPKVDPDLIPDVKSEYQRTPEDDAVDAVIGGIDIVEAYRRWCGKMDPNPGSKRESIMVSCPTPGHADRDPSAWLNLDKGTWYSAVCQVGGDGYDIASYHFNIPDYKSTGFGELRRRMAEDLGYVVRRTLGGTEYAEKIEPEPNPDPKSDPNPNLKSKSPLATVTPLPVDSQNKFIELPIEPTIDWRILLSGFEDTFLWKWMQTCSQTNLPEEYFFWLGLQAIGLAAGNNVVLDDDPTITSNLFICLCGSSGIGKSRATHYLTKLLREALPYDHDDMHSTGTLMVPDSGSAESLVDSFSKPELDPTDPKKIIRYWPIRGLVRFDELATFVSRASRTGNLHSKTKMMELYDGYESSVDHKSRGSGLIVAENPFCSAVTTTQPRSIRDLLTRADADAGFLGRWVFIFGREKRRDSYRTKKVDIKSCVTSLRELRAWSVTRQISLEGDALERWDQFFHDKLEPHRKANKEDSLFTRLDLLLKKLMVQFSINAQVEAVTPEIVDQATALFPYLVHTFTQLSTQIGAGEFEDLRTAIKDLLHSRSESITKREINRALPARYPREILPKVLKTMLEIGEIQEELSPRTSTGGRPTARYRYAG